MTTNLISKKLNNRPEDVATEKRPVLMEGDTNLREGDIIAVEGSVNNTQLVVGLASSISGGGRFLDMQTLKKVKSLYMNGTLSVSELKNLANRFSESPPQISFLTDEDFSGDNEIGMFNVLNPVFQAQLLDHLKEETGCKAVFFDKVPAVSLEPKNDQAVLGLRRLIVEIRKLGIFQAWVLQEGKKISTFPPELATAVWTVSPTSDKSVQSLKIGMSEMANASNRSQTITARILESETGSLEVVRREKADMVTVLNMIARGLNQGQIGDALGYDQSTVSRRFKNLGLEDAGLIRKNGTGYALTDAGREYLDNPTQ